MSIKRLIVIAHLAANWHSGMSSRGYRLLCATQRALKRRKVTKPLDIPITGKYKCELVELAKRYGDKL